MSNGLQEENDRALDHGSTNVRLETQFLQPENPFTRLVPSQDLAIVSRFELESGVVLHDVPVAYKAFGKLSPNADNAMVICHALTGNADVSDWWGPMLGGDGKAFDTSRFYVICFNCLGSPYGSASPLTYKHGDPTKGCYGPEFPLTSVRDDVKIFKLILDALGVKQIATVIGGSMGGGSTLEFAYFGKDYVRTIIPIATSARYSAWGISWGEAQRQSIYSDPKYQDGYYNYDDPPSSGLGAARMAALLTYRSRDSFESRFGRNVPDTSKKQSTNGISHDNEHFAIHNDGHRNAGSPRPSPALSSKDVAPTRDSSKTKSPTYFSAQSYLRYQGEKFIKRFDANCYIAITRKLDTHDISRGRVDHLPAEYSPQQKIHEVLGQIEQPTLVLGIESDGLFTFAEQLELVAGIPDSRIEKIESPEGHDAFLLEFEQVNTHLIKFMKEKLPDIMNKEPNLEAKSAGVAAGGTTGMVSEVDEITAW